jgi:hypothetical protein
MCGVSKRARPSTMVMPRERKPSSARAASCCTTRSARSRNSSNRRSAGFPERPYPSRLPGPTASAKADRKMRPGTMPLPRRTGGRARQTSAPSSTARPAAAMPAGPPPSTTISHAAFVSYADVSGITFHPSLHPRDSSRILTRWGPCPHPHSPSSAVRLYRTRLGRENRSGLASACSGRALSAARLQDGWSVGRARCVSSWVPVRE